MRVTALLLTAGPSKDGILTNEAVEKAYSELPTVPPSGLPLHYELDGRVIGKITNVIMHLGRGVQSKIVVDAIVTDPELLDQPWLNLESIVERGVVGEYWGRAIEVF